MLFDNVYIILAVIGWQVLDGYRIHTPQPVFRVPGSLVYFLGAQTKKVPNQSPAVFFFFFQR